MRNQACQLHPLIDSITAGAIGLCGDRVTLPTAILKWQCGEVTSRWAPTPSPLAAEGV
jgi:hypothetical protein